MLTKTGVKMRILQILIPRLFVNRVFLTSVCRPQNDLLCVGWEVKPYILTHSLTYLLLAYKSSLHRPTNIYQLKT